MGSALGQEMGCFCTPRRTFGKSLSGSLTPPTKSTMGAFVEVRIPTKTRKVAPIEAIEKRMPHKVSSWSVASASCLVLGVIGAC